MAGDFATPLAVGRVTLPNFRGMLHGARRLREIYGMTPEELRTWYPPVQASLMGVPLPPTP